MLSGIPYFRWLEAIADMTTFSSASNGFTVMRVDRKEENLKVEEMSYIYASVTALCGKPVWEISVLLTSEQL